MIIKNSNILLWVFSQHTNLIKFWKRTQFIFRLLFCLWNSENSYSNSPKVFFCLTSCLKLQKYSGNYHLHLSSTRWTPVKPTNHVSRPFLPMVWENKTKTSSDTSADGKALWKTKVPEFFRVHVTHRIYFQFCHEMFRYLQMTSKCAILNLISLFILPLQPINRSFIWPATNLSADITTPQTDITSQHETVNRCRANMHQMNSPMPTLRSACSMIVSFCGREMQLKRSTTLLTSTAVWSGSLRYCASSSGLAFCFRCNLILWENLLTKGNSCLGVATLCPHGKREWFCLWLAPGARFLLKQTSWRKGDCDVKTHKRQQIDGCCHIFVRKTAMEECFGLMKKKKVSWI